MRREKSIGRPPKEIEDKLCHSITIKLKIGDYCDLLERAERMKISLVSLVRESILRGKVKRPYNDEELHLMRQLSGIANNLNQIAKHLNSGEIAYKLYACAAIKEIKKLINDSKKH